jgi:hypothetical protein
MLSDTAGRDRTGHHCERRRCAEVPPRMARPVAVVAVHRAVGEQHVGRLRARCQLSAQFYTSARPACAIGGKHAAPYRRRKGLSARS